MHLVLIGVNHRSAPVELREKLSIPFAELPEALSRLMSLDSVSEGLLLSTCNRMEVYACTPSKAYDTEIVGFMDGFLGVPAAELEPHLYIISGHKAAEHLFRVAAGLDSMVMGETQILGQVRDAYTAAAEQGSTGSVLNALFQRAIGVGKRAHSETAISRGSFSIGSAAVQLGKSIFEDLGNRLVLVIGAGKMARNTVVNLASAGAHRLVVANRTFERAEELASEFGGSAIPFSDIGDALETADIVITSTGMSGVVISREMAAAAARRRRGAPIFLIDIAVPRDIEETAGEVENVFLYNIDDLEAVVEADNARRQCEVERVEAIVQEELEKFLRWFRTLDAVPVITALQSKIERIRQAELESLSRKLPHLSPADIEAINATTRTIVNRICHQPVLQIRDYAVHSCTSKLDVVCEAFGLDPDLPDDRETADSVSGGKSDGTG